MKQVNVQAGRPYVAEIGPGVVTRLPECIHADCPKAQRVVVVSDDSVFPRHGERVLELLRGADIAAQPYVLPHGEATKSAENLIALLNFLVEQQLTRSDALVALGGGVIGDLTGFAAAVYMRGIGYFQLPTTLLAAVDSSVGGKTAVDLPAGKNLMGAFWQPRHVLCDTELLATLPDTFFTDGCAEVIKTAVLFDPDLFAVLQSDGRDFDREAVITRCVEHKRDVVAEDEFDTGRRALLNLGHTLAHAAEACSNFSLSHGRSVAIGTAVVCRAAARRGLLDEAEAQKIVALLKQFGLPTVTDISIDRLMKPMLKDKKRSGAKVSVIVPRSIGQCEVMPMDAAALRSFMEEGLNE